MSKKHMKYTLILIVTSVISFGFGYYANHKSKESIAIINPNGDYESQHGMLGIDKSELIYVMYEDLNDGKCQTGTYKFITDDVIQFSSGVLKDQLGVFTQDQLTIHKKNDTITYNKKLDSVTIPQSCDWK